MELCNENEIEENDAEYNLIYLTWNPLRCVVHNQKRKIRD
jgi:hypothetical protein